MKINDEFEFEGFLTPKEEIDAKVEELKKKGWTNIEVRDAYKWVDPSGAYAIPTKIYGKRQANRKDIAREIKRFKGMIEVLRKDEREKERDIRIAKDQVKLMRKEMQILNKKIHEFEKESRKTKVMVT